jgi:hypothetical protein
VRWWFVLAQIGCGFAPAASHEPPLEAGTVVDTPQLDAPIDGPPIPIVYVQGSVMTSSSSNAVSIAATFAGPQTAGNLDILLVSSLANTDAIVAVVDTSGNPYTSLGFTTRNGYAQAAYFAPNIRAAAANIVTVSFGAGGSNRPELRIAEYSGIAADPLDTSATAVGTSDLSDSGPITTTHAHDLIVGANTVSLVTTGPGPMFTQRVIIQGDLLEDREVHSAGTFHATAPIDAAADWDMLVAAFKGAR